MVVAEAMNVGAQKLRNTDHLVLCSFRANKTLYSNVSLIPLPADYEPALIDMPSARINIEEDSKS